MQGTPKSLVMCPSSYMLVSYGFKSTEDNKAKQTYRDESHSNKKRIANAKIYGKTKSLVLWAAHLPICLGVFNNRVVVVI